MKHFGRKTKLEREAILLRQLMHLIDLRHGDVITVDPDSALPLSVHVEHYSRRLRDGLVEYRHQYRDDELHGGKIIVEKHNPVLVRLF